VRFAEKGDYFLAIRTPANTFCGGRIHCHRIDGKPVTPKEASDTFKLIFTSSTKVRDGKADYVSLSYQPINYLGKKEIAADPKLVADPFEIFLDYLEAAEVVVAREVGLAVYMDSVKERLEEEGLFPIPEGTKVKKLEPLVVEVGGWFIKHNKIVKDI
jgi:hypothetical protein